MIDILTMFILVPIVTIFFLVFISDKEKVKWIALTGMSVQFVMSLNLIIQFIIARKSNDDLMLFKEDYVWFEQFNIHYAIGVDEISVAMIVLTSIVVLAGVFISWKVQDLTKEFFISLIVLALGVYGFFISIDLFTLFVFYEIAVIPMYLLIGIWGSGRKEYAAMKLTLMLMGASALLLVGVLGIYFNSGGISNEFTFNIFEISQANISTEVQNLFFPITFIGFAVLGAMFPFHTWSPDGHASAPTAVSMLHAGVLMKLGGYGIFRVAMFLLPEGAINWSDFFIVLSVIGVFYGALAAIKQTDLKYINAYSSVSHLGMVLFALLMLNKTSWNGAMLQSLSHGFMTAMFFALIGMIYSRTHTRDVRKLGGLLKVIPFISVMYVIAGLASLGLPGFSGFMAEMQIFVGAFEHPDMFHRVATIITVSSIVITAVYILRVVGKMLMGPVENSEFLSLKKATWYEKTGIVLLLIPIVFMGIFPLWISDFIRNSLQPYLENVL